MADGEAANRERAWRDGHWQSADGLTLHYRDYPGGEAAAGAPADASAVTRPVLLCLPGLTRNARDFGPLAARLAGEWRLVCPDLRGRGESAAAKDSASYVPLVYADDVRALIDALGLGRVAVIGTSLGGIIAMILAMTDPGRLAGVCLNDVGPVIEEAGLERIRGHVGAGGSQPTWMHAARALAETHGRQYPDYSLHDWLAMAKRLCRLNATGRIVFDYDMRIAEPFRLPAAAGGVDLWPAIDALARVPTLVVRGALSDILSADTARTMAARLGPDAELATVPRVGHAPLLDEPAAAAAIDRWLARIAR